MENKTENNHAAATPQIAQAVTQKFVAGKLLALNADFVVGKRYTFIRAATDKAGVCGSAVFVGEGKMSADGMGYDGLWFNFSGANYNLRDFAEYYDGKKITRAAGNSNGDYLLASLPEDAAAIAEWNAAIVARDERRKQQAQTGPRRNVGVGAMAVRKALTGNEVAQCLNDGVDFVFAETKPGASTPHLQQVWTVVDNRVKAIGEFFDGFGDPDCEDKSEETIADVVARCADNGIRFYAAKNKEQAAPPDGEDPPPPYEYAECDLGAEGVYGHCD